MTLEKVISVQELSEKGKTIFKKGNKQIALFKINDSVFAIDNRCPHEGYPLLQGSHNESCVLTCNWHNWKFDLKDGKCLTGGDNVVTYPVVIKDDYVFVDLFIKSIEQIQSEILEGLKIGFQKRQYGRISRELSRFIFNKIDPIIAVKEVIKWSYNKFEDGTTHAYAVAGDWIRLYLESNNQEEKIIYLTELIDYISLESLRHPIFSFNEGILDWDHNSFVKAVEDENEDKAISFINGFFINKLDYKFLEKALVEIALNHYNDFGHSLIYVQKTSYLIEKLGNDVAKPLVSALVRSIIKATREDLLPEFSKYKEYLEANPKLTNSQGFFMLNVNESMNNVISSFNKYLNEEIYDLLLQSNAKNMLYFDISYQYKVDNKVSENIGWLDFTHALTFSNAVRELCSKYPQYWKKALLQLACFSGRNVDYLDDELQEEDFFVKDINEFVNSFYEKITDHGLTSPIFPAHLLKTFIAVMEEVKHSNNDITKKYLLASLNRFLNSPIKQKHIKRTIKQSIELVSRDFM